MSGLTSWRFLDRRICMGYDCSECVVHRGDVGVSLPVVTAVSMLGKDTVKRGNAVWQDGWMAPALPANQPSSELSFGKVA